MLFCGIIGRSLEVLDLSVDIGKYNYKYLDKIIEKFLF